MSRICYYKQRKRLWLYNHIVINRYICAKLLRLVVITSIINCALGFGVPTYFQLVLGGLTMFNFLRKDKISMSTTIMKAVGAGAVGPSESSQLRRQV